MTHFTCENCKKYCDYNIELFKITFDNIDFNYCKECGKRAYDNFLKNENDN